MIFSIVGVSVMYDNEFVLPDVVYQTIIAESSCTSHFLHNFLHKACDPLHSSNLAGHRVCVLGLMVSGSGFQGFATSEFRVKGNMRSG